MKVLECLRNVRELHCPAFVIFLAELEKLYLALPFSSEKP